MSTFELETDSQPDADRRDTPAHSRERGVRTGAWDRTQRVVRPPTSQRRRSAGLAVVVVAALSALVAIVGSMVMFPLLSDNNDEAIYLQQAETLLDGELFMPAPDPPAAFRPWLSAVVDGKYVFKYAPVHAGMIAAAKLVLGSERAALGVIAAGAVATSYLLAREVLRRRREAVLACVLLALSPLFVVQSATFLAYLSTLVFLQGFAAALLAGIRRGSAGLLALSGLLLGTAFFSRPYDATLFAIPLLMWLVWRSRAALGRLAKEAGWVAVGALPPLAGMLAYYWAATGHPLRTPFNLLEHTDTVGFGERRMLPIWGSVDYTPARAWEGLTRYLMLDSLWCFGGLVLVGLAGWGLWQHRRSSVETWLASVALAVPLGYFLFWGSYGSTEWGAPWRIGPFYHMLVLVPLTVLGAKGLARLWSWDRQLTALAAAGMLAVSSVVVWTAVQRNEPFNDERERLHRPLLDADLDNAIVFLPPLQDEWLLLPFALARNDAHFDGPVVWVIDRGDHNNLDVLTRFPGRTPYRLVATGEVIDTFPSLDYETRLEEQMVTGGQSIDLDVLIGPRQAPAIVVEVGFAERIDTFVVDAGVAGWQPLRLGVGPERTELSGPLISRSTRARGANVDGLSVALGEAMEGGSVRRVTQKHLPVAARGDELETIAPTTVNTKPNGQPEPFAVIAPDPGTRSGA